MTDTERALTGAALSSCNTADSDSWREGGQTFLEGDQSMRQDNGQTGTHDDGAFDLSSANFSNGRRRGRDASSKKGEGGNEGELHGWKGRRKGG